VDVADDGRHPVLLHQRRQDRVALADQRDEPERLVLGPLLLHLDRAGVVAAVVVGLEDEPAAVDRPGFVEGGLHDGGGVTQQPGVEAGLGVEQPDVDAVAADAGGRARPRRRRRRRGGRRSGRGRTGTARRCAGGPGGTGRTSGGGRSTGSAAGRRGAGGGGGRSRRGGGRRPLRLGRARRRRPRGPGGGAGGGGGDRRRAGRCRRRGGAGSGGGDAGRARRLLVPQVNGVAGATGPDHAHGDEDGGQARHRPPASGGRTKHRWSFLYSSLVARWPPR